METRMRSTFGYFADSVLYVRSIEEARLKSLYPCDYSKRTTDDRR